MYRIEINTKKRILSLFNDNNLIKHYPVAVGKPSTPTPHGNWTITKKGLWGAQFGGHFMQLSVPWGIYGIHGTDKPWSISQAVSHGCVRMYSNDAAELYNLVPIGTPVYIY
ncbi:L,D-transpeptidase [Pseudobacteroides cellulosolvens]|uniref:ErfK/YbiS/YcfS/YnhG family protein n=1 Tax=Pseudobacteroides cellulosolvens ATCC 35603 = DSM 2933 TaxID=398512 RepID=A0A0L6JU83_9FIRM|nr:L,D-transpeptidase [Pseudobacteroides cellulosolvens]KNY29416.1 ErfK/YbiS/YcfS/YnhG family protein [Pseudobacteroides cellulosolvens ATCC 35603 = DSM 2933]